MKSLILACKTQHLANFNAKKTRKPALFQHFYSKNMKRCRFSCFFDPEISRMLCFTMQNQLFHEILHFFFFLRNSLQLGPPPPYSHLIALMMGRAWVHVPYWLPNLPELWLQQIKALLTIALHLSCENTASCALSSFHKLRAHSDVLWYIYIYIYIYTHVYSRGALSTGGEA